MRTHHLATLLAALPLTLAMPAHAQWTANGFGVATGATIEFLPAACRDGANGVFIAWVDCRNGANTDLYLLRLQGDGSPAPGWPAGGLGIVTQADAQTLPVIAPEASGGCWLAWSDYRDGGIDVFVTRVLGDGSIAPGWPTDGLPAASGVQVRTEPSLVADGATGVYVAWSEVVAGLQKDLRLAHYESNGAATAGWPATGRVLSTGANANVSSALCSDGGTGVFACWQELGASGTVRLRRAATDGSFPAGWSSPLPVFSSLTSITPVQVVPGPSGSAFVVAGIAAGAPTGLDAWAQRIAADGSVALGWAPAGLALCDAPAAQQHVRAIADGTGGALVAWQDLRGADPQLYTTRVDSAGSTGTWTANGTVLVSSAVRGAPSIALDGTGNFLAFIEDATSGGSELRAAGGTLAGGALAGWGVDGNLACDAPDAQTDPIAVPSDAGSAIVVWTDYRSGTQHDVYAAKLTSDGSVPALASLVRASATPDAVDLEWYVPGEPGAIAVERATGAEAWVTLGETSADGAGFVRWRDGGVVAGHTYDYRLRLAGARTLGETRVQVPRAAGFALESPWPNPARGAWSAAFALDSSAPATLSVLDATGRVVASRDATLGAGRHVLALGASALRPGLYFVRLEQGARREVRRLAVAR